MLPELGWNSNPLRCEPAQAITGMEGAVCYQERVPFTGSCDCCYLNRSLSGFFSAAGDHKNPSWLQGRV